MSLYSVLRPISFVRGNNKMKCVTWLAAATIVQAAISFVLFPSDAGARELPYVIKPPYLISDIDVSENRKTVYAFGQMPRLGDTSIVPAGAPIPSPSGAWQEGDREGHLIVLSYDDPANPKVISDIMTGNVNPIRSCVAGNKLFLQGEVGFFGSEKYKSGYLLQIFDISDERNPRLEINIPGNTHYISEDGKTVIVMGQPLDVSDPAHARRIEGADSMVRHTLDRVDSQELGFCNRGSSRRFEKGFGWYDQYQGLKLSHSGSKFVIEDLSKGPGETQPDIVPVGYRNYFHFALLPGKEDLVIVFSRPSENRIVFLSGDQVGECANGEDQIGNVICASPYLTLLDRDLNYLYQDKLENLSEEEQSAERKQQREWLKGFRGSCSQLSDDSPAAKYDCVKAAYMTKLGELSAYQGRSLLRPPWVAPKNGKAGEAAPWPVTASAPPPVATFAFAPSSASPATQPGSAAEPLAAPPMTLPSHIARFSDCYYCPTMVVVPKGAFAMGAPPDAFKNEPALHPQHLVSIESFALGETVVTFKQWDACVADGGCNNFRPFDEGWGREDRPVVNITFEDIDGFLTWLNKKAKPGQPAYRLPSEAEWEYAARAGATTTYWWGNDQGGGHTSCVGCGSQWDNRQTAPVKSFPPNPLGLYEMTGNVWQWVADCFNGDYEGAPTDGSAWMTGNCNSRVIRGGAWDYPYPWTSLASRKLTFKTTNRTGPNQGTWKDIGFRVAKSMP